MSLAPGKYPLLLIAIFDHDHSRQHRAFVRVQNGLRSHGGDWVDISRGLGEEEPDRETNATRELATHEMVVRAQYRAWLDYMQGAA